MRPEQLLRPEKAGLYCEAGDFYIDPVRPVERALITHGRHDLIVLVNLLHLISWPETRTLIGEAAAALVPGGRLVIYGPFLRDGALTSDGDAAFHASLTAADPEIGYKNDADIRAALKAAGLEPREAVEMPANNLTLVAEKPTV